MGIYAHIHNILLSIWRLADPLKLSPLHLSQVLLFFSLKSFMSIFSLHFQSSHPHTSLTAIIFLLLPNTSGFILNATYTQIRFNYFFSSKISFNIFIYSKVSLSVFQCSFPSSKLTKVLYISFPQLLVVENTKASVLLASAKFKYFPLSEIDFFLAVCMPFFAGNFTATLNALTLPICPPAVSLFGTCTDMLLILISNKFYSAHFLHCYIANSEGKTGSMSIVPVPLPCLPFLLPVKSIMLSVKEHVQMQLNTSSKYKISQ